MPSTCAVLQIMKTSVTSYNYPYTSLHRQKEMEYFVLEDIGSMIQNEAIKRLLSPMMVQLCHLILSADRSDVNGEAFASLEKPAEALAQATEEFVQIAKR